MGCPIRKSTGLRLFPPIRGISQVVASFIGFSYQGIHHMPLVTYPKFLNTDRFVLSLIINKKKSIIYFFRLSKTLIQRIIVFTLSKFQRTKLSGANRDRTDNLRLARAALSQLSYSPKNFLGLLGLG